MFESIEVLAAHLRATAPPPPGRDASGRVEAWGAGFDPDRALVTEIVELARVKAMVEGREMVLMAALVDRAEGLVDLGLRTPWPMGNIDFGTVRWE